VGVHDLFEQTRQKAAVIIFINELDALAAHAPPLRARAGSMKKSESLTSF
jgi:ATP-dependent 26S proteasome regulatory subunit